MLFKLHEWRQLNDGLYLLIIGLSVYHEYKSLANHLIMFYRTNTLRLGSVTDYGATFINFFWVCSVLVYWIVFNMASECFYDFFDKFDIFAFRAPRDGCFRILLKWFCWVVYNHIVAHHSLLIILCKKTHVIELFSA